MEFIVIILFSTVLALIAYLLGWATSRWLVLNKMASRWLPMTLAAITWLGMTYYNVSLWHRDTSDRHGVTTLSRKEYDSVVRRVDSILGDSASRVLKHPVPGINVSH